MFFSWIENPKKLKNELLQLKSNTVALWGRMDAQQMIEHLIIVCEISNGTTDVKVLTPKKNIKKAQAFLMSEQEMPKNFIAKFIPKEPLAYKYEDLPTAIQTFIYSINIYHSYWVDKKDSTRNHPVFGKLNKKMWNRVHNKHITHHLLQFGLSK